MDSRGYEIYAGAVSISIGGGCLGFYYGERPNYGTTNFPKPTTTPLFR